MLKSVMSDNLILQPSVKTMVPSVPDIFLTFPEIDKIRWLIKQAYGFRDREYFKLKIYQLPEISSEKSL